MGYQFKIYNIVKRINESSFFIFKKIKNIYECENLWGTSFIFRGIAKCLFTSFYETLTASKLKTPIELNFMTFFLRFKMPYFK